MCWLFTARLQGPVMCDVDSRVVRPGGSRVRLLCLGWFVGLLLVGMDDPAHGGWLWC